MFKLYLKKKFNTKLDILNLKNKKFIGKVFRLKNKNEIKRND